MMDEISSMAPESMSDVIVEEEDPQETKEERIERVRCTIGLIFIVFVVGPFNACMHYFCTEG